MTDHETYRGLSAGYVLGALDQEERRRFEAHLAECGECRREVASFAPIPRLLDGAAGPEAGSLPEAVADRAAARARSEWSEMARSRRRWRWVAGAAAVMALVLGAVALIPDSSGTEPTPLAVEAGPASGVVTVDARPWGTSLHLDIEGLPRLDRYVAWVVDVEGNREQAATWGPTDAGVAILDGASSIPTERVSAVVVTDAGGGEMLLTAVAG